MKTSSLSARTWYVLLQVYKKAFIERRTPKDDARHRFWNLTKAEELFERYDDLLSDRPWQVHRGVEEHSGTKSKVV